MIYSKGDGGHGFLPRIVAGSGIGLCLLAQFVCGIAAAAELPQAGGLESLPQPRRQTVDLLNPGFEDESDGWDSRSQGAFEVVQSGARTGQNCLRFDAAATTRYTPSVRQAIRNVQPGVYTLRFWLKLNDVRAPDRGVAGLRVGIEYQRAGGQRARGTTEVFNGTFDWRPVQVGVLLPNDVKDDSVHISIHRYNKPPGGEAFIDDFTLEREVPPPVETFLRFPNYRGYLPEDGPQTVRLWVKVNETETNEPVQIDVTNCDNGTKVASRVFESTDQEGVIEFDAADWPLGRYAVRAMLGEYEYPAYFVQKISAEQRKAFDVWFDEHNVLHLHGKPVFPLALYNTVRQFAVVDDAEIARLDKMAEAPVNLNVNYTWWPSTIETRRSYLSEMQKRGIFYLDTLMPFVPGYVKLSADAFPIGNELIPELGGRLDTQQNCDQFVDRLARQMREMPGHAGWYVMDERPFDRVPTIFHQYCLLRRADPTHPTYGVSNKAAELFKWRDTFDVFGMDPYPLMNMKAGRPLSLAGEEARVSCEATQGSRPLWMVIQFFQGWSTDRWPTEEELRTMSLMAVTEGARGLFYWSFGIRALLWVKDPQEREEYWQRLVAVTKELKSLEPALVAPDAPELVKSVSDEQIRWRARVADGKWYVFAYRPAKHFDERANGDPLAVTFTLKDGQRVRKTFGPDTADWFEVTPE